ncbi:MULTISPECIES: sugar phosphate isomerase/epimerase family protein [Sphingobium]|uniref:sugar phosphate isomerase/epimerase family protein n=1 Tax=Sphingobium sp. MI1205 TaxID=407020 RepID=UPI0007819958|nr:sugar phosphate isomerase/epimerase family protein [Sphingobium sp. MI1205]
MEETLSGRQPPMAHAAPDLLAAHWLLAGQRPTADPLPCPIPLTDRVRAAQRAGFAGIGLIEPELVDAVAIHGVAGMRSLLADHGMRHLEIEALTGWWGDDDDWRRSLDTMLDLGGQLGARILKVTGDFAAEPASTARMTDRFAAVVERARGSGVVLALEIIAFSNIADVPSALAVLGDSRDEEAGLMLDSWHFARRSLPLQSLAGLPRSRIAGVEISDVTPGTPDDLFTDTVDHRHVPGEGAYDLPAFLQAVAQTGYDGPVGLEVLSAPLRNGSLDDALQRCAHGARAIMARGH